MSNTIQSLRGMKDLTGTESELFIYFIENASKIAQKYGFSYIETPLLEETALFKRSVGESSDIVNKEMYQFIDKGQNDVCLRPEGTAGVVRHFVEKKLDRAGGTYKWYYYGPMFRYERPQKGRLREFHQFGCEVFGISSVYEDANIISLIKEILDFFGIGFTLKLNSLGCADCMPKYKENLVKHISNFKEKLCEDCNKRLMTNPIRVLDCKVESCKQLLENAPKITNSLCNSCNNDFEKLKEILDFNNISYEVDSNLVRGLDYYNKTAFEFVSSEIGAQSAIAGGGRYDRLVEFLGGKSTSGIGFAIGIERLLELVKIKEKKEDFIYIGVLDEISLNQAFEVAIKKRKTIKTHLEYTPRGFAKHFANAQKLGCNIVALIGEKELNDGTIYIKNLDTKEEENINLGDF
ncbi:histidine--tRNA ligase [Aliarcobacter trophiarum LMG 25534]|uniref:Histidine--tRNA ligase n=1 Tax=Aliarcobacter trophiarum LMG 25534 TaxID=1032241 RepID=A0AAD0QK26_9BACT|nr:histidine--tRNA ligase [Aliarcobacter trophiarum]AXK49196.1 histidyl-tRNA synthetase [Aliarcobacter trophiarum LMG 25534]RXI25519.1 histidine--tRNA ligase [Aliarcobacter trophiarum]RXJ89825.1 histidine--tRNA ligase [Aliarcobacter trophiarum LMG 25534]